MIDTHQLISDLQSAGFNTQQAKGISDAMRQLHDEVVTKDYLRAELATLQLRVIISQVAVASMLFAALKLF